MEGSAQKEVEESFAFCFFHFNLLKDATARRYLASRRNPWDELIFLHLDIAFSRTLSNTLTLFMKFPTRDLLLGQMDPSRRQRRGGHSQFLQLSNWQPIGPLVASPANPFPVDRVCPGEKPRFFSLQDLLQVLVHCGYSLLERLGCQQLDFHQKCAATDGEVMMCKRYCCRLCKNSFGPLEQVYI